MKSYQRIIIITLVLVILSFFNNLYAEVTWDKTFGGTGDDEGQSVWQTSDYGYIITGRTESYGAGSGDVWLIKTDASGNKLWDKTFGGTGLDFGRSVQQTSEGGYIIAGGTTSYGAGLCDNWLIKTDADGNKLWDKTFGGTNTEESFSVQQTNDGGYIITGSYSSGAVVYVWLIKTDASGNEEWSKTYGDVGQEKGSDILQTENGEYLILGTTTSSGAGGMDVWLLKVDSGGELLWDKTNGGSLDEEAYRFLQTTEGDLVIIASTDSFSYGETDLWVIKVDESGNEKWHNNYGDFLVNKGFSIEETEDNGYIIAGWTSDYKADVLLVKTDSNGVEEWFQTFGASGSIDEGYAVKQASDGNYLVVGSTQSYGSGSDDVWMLKCNAEISEWKEILDNEGYGKSVIQTADGGYLVVGTTHTSSSNSNDVFLVKTDSIGRPEWSKTYGGQKLDEGECVQSTSDGGYIIVGSTKSFEDAQEDVYLIKTGSFGNEVWSQTFGGTLQDWGFGVQQTSDNGYIIVGTTALTDGNGYDAYLIKTDSSGNLVWEQTYGGGSTDWTYSVDQTFDGGYILAGATPSYPLAKYSEGWLIKTGPLGFVQWMQFFEMGHMQACYSVQQTSDGGYIVTGKGVDLTKTNASGIEVWSLDAGLGDGYAVQQVMDGGFIFIGEIEKTPVDNSDAALMKVSYSGDLQWIKTFNGLNAKEDIGYSGKQTTDGGYIITGLTDDVGSYNANWLIYYNAQELPPFTTNISFRENILVFLGIFLLINAVLILRKVKIS